MQTVSVKFQDKENIPVVREFAKQQKEVSQNYSLQVQLVPPGFQSTDKNKENSSNQENELQEKKNLNPFANEFRPTQNSQKNSKQYEEVQNHQGLVVKKVKLDDKKILGSIDNTLYNKTNEQIEEEEKEQQR